jgi:hypothetical protein
MYNIAANIFKITVLSIIKVVTVVEDVDAGTDADAVMDFSEVVRTAITVITPIYGS